MSVYVCLYNTASHVVLIMDTNTLASQGTSNLSSQSPEFLMLRATWKGTSDHIVCIMYR